MVPEIYDYINDNIEYCEYVFLKNYELDLDLRYADIQVIANNYISALIKEGYEVDDEVIENDELLREVVAEIKGSTKEEGSEFDVLDPLEQKERILERLKHERELHSHGGHFYDDSYDDLSYDDIEDIHLGR